MILLKKNLVLFVIQVDFYLNKIMNYFDKLTIHTKIMEKKKESKEDYATEDPTKADAKSQEDMAKEAIKKFKSLNN